MRNLRVTLLLLTAFLSPTFGAVPQSITLDIQNMSCAVCPITVKKALEGVAGVDAVSIDFARRTARVTYDPDKAKPADLTAATTHAGYPSTVQK